MPDRRAGVVAPWVAGFTRYWTVGQRVTKIAVSEGTGCDGDEEERKDAVETHLVKKR